MHVHHVRPEVGQQAAHVARRPHRPQRLGGETRRGERVDLRVVALVPAHLVAARREQRCLGVDHRLLAAALAIGIVHNQYFHALTQRITPEAKRSTIAAIE